LMKIPEPMVPPMTSMVASKSPSRRARGCDRTSAWVEGEFERSMIANGNWLQLANSDWQLAKYLITASGNWRSYCSSEDGVCQQRGGSKESVILIPQSGRRICSRWALGGADFSPAMRDSK